MALLQRLEPCQPFIDCDLSHISPPSIDADYIGQRRCHRRRRVVNSVGWSPNLIFNEGYTANSGERLVREDLCTEAIRLGRLLALFVDRRESSTGMGAVR